MTNMRTQGLRRRRRQEASTVLVQRPIVTQYCQCGNIAPPVYGERCEDCWVEDQIRWNGHSKRVKVLYANE